VAFSALAWRGLALGTLALTVVLCALLGWTLRTGLGRVPDVLLGLAAGGFAILVLGGMAALVRFVLASCPWRLVVAVPGPYVLLAGLAWFLGFPPAAALVLPALLILAVGGLGGGISALFRSHATRLSTIVGAAVSILLALGLTTFLVFRLRAPGSDPYLQPAPEARSVAPVQAPDPGTPGLWKTARLTYGSGQDARRREFGSQAALRTRPVDASLLLPGFKGFKARIRKWYWGFGPEAFPLNAHVTYPVGLGPFPLILAVHGNHEAPVDSDTGYDYLGDLLASRGFIFVSVDENFLNGSWEGGIDKENATRAWLLLKHLEAWRAWNGTPSNPFQDKVDLANVGLIGHSRGGEAVALAAAFNKLPCDPENAALPFAFGFGIRAVVAIAPCDGQYEPTGLPTPLEDTPYFVLQGSHDSDVSDFAGQRPYRRARFSGAQYGFKAALWLYRANHGQFNTVWGRFDQAPPLSWFLATGPLMAGEDQRRIAQVFISGFLEATLHGRREYVPMFRDPAAAAAWLPRALLLNQYEDSTYHPVHRFDTGLDLTRATLPGATIKGENLTVWRQGMVEGRGDWSFRSRAVHLGWARGAGLPSYTLELPALDWSPALTSRLVLSLAASDEDPQPGGKAPAGEATKEPIDFTVELVDADGTVARVPLSRVRSLPPAFKVRFTKWDLLERTAYHRPWEPVFQTVELPLTLFKEAVPSWSPTELREIRLVFDRTPRGLVLLDQVGLTD